MLQQLRQLLRTPVPREPAPAARPELVVRAELGRKLLRIVGRAVAIRHVDAGSCNACELEAHALMNPYYNVEGLGIKFVASPRHADVLLVTGPVTKHMAIALRRTYDALPVQLATAEAGDVAARVAVRFDELAESLRLVRAIVDALPSGDIAVQLPETPAFRKGLGYVEGWRGPVMVALECGPGATIRRCHPHDPSWSNWPVLEHAVIGNIVPDFPLINKSFNLSYSGHDL